MSDFVLTPDASAPTVFNFHNAEVRIIIRDGEPWFVATDVCAALDLKNVSSALASLDEDERNTLSLTEGIHSGPGNPQVNIISESGLYSLTIRSRKPVARKFAKWVTGEVLPTIRKTGSYTAPTKPYTARPGDRLTLEEAATLRRMLTDAANEIASYRQQGMFMREGWSKLKSHFGVSYRQIPRAEFQEAVSLLARHIADNLPAALPPQSTTQFTLIPVEGEHAVHNAPAVTLPPDVQAALDSKAWTLAAEAHKIIHRHLLAAVDERAYGYPERTVDTPMALDKISTTTLDEALSPSSTDLGLLKFMSDNIVESAKKYAETIQSGAQALRARGVLIGPVLAAAKKADPKND